MLSRPNVVGFMTAEVDESAWPDQRFAELVKKRKKKLENAGGSPDRTSIVRQKGITSWMV